MKKLILTTATLVSIGLIAFAYESGKHTKNDGSVKQCGKIYKDLKNISRQDDLPQEIKFGIQSKNSQHIKQYQLRGARRLSDIISNYPVNWITDYVSVEIMATCHDKTMKVVSANDILSVEQINLLNTIEVNTDIQINVNYTYKVPVTDVIEKNTMHVAMTLVPDVEAEYRGGKEQMINYLNDQITIFFKNKPEQFQKATIRFTVNEEGSITNAKVSNSTGYDQIYLVLLEAIYKMPKWKPAENSNGVRINQEFEFTVGRYGC